ncbi:hypothetical protein B0T20DRAFT_316158, partial [Sordaria brevicollis]
MPGLKQKKTGQQQVTKRVSKPQMEPRTGPGTYHQGASHRQRPEDQMSKSDRISAALDDFLHNNPKGHNLKFFAARYDVKPGTLQVRRWREEMRDMEMKKKMAMQARDGNGGEGGAEGESGTRSTTTRPEDGGQSLVPSKNLGKRASKEHVAAACDEYLNSETPVSATAIAKKYGLHPSTMYQRISLMGGWNGLGKRDGVKEGRDNGQKTRSGGSTRRVSAPILVPSPSPEPEIVTAPESVPTSAIATGSRQGKMTAETRATAERINSAMEYIINNNPGSHCYQYVAKKFGVGRRTLFNRAKKLRAAGFHVPASKLPSGGSRKRTAARKQNTKMPTITGSGSSRREGQGQQQQSQTKPSAGSAEEAITAIT